MEALQNQVHIINTVSSSIIIPYSIGGYESVMSKSIAYSK